MGERLALLRRERERYLVTVAVAHDKLVADFSNRTRDRPNDGLAAAIVRLNHRAVTNRHPASVASEERAAGLRAEILANAFQQPLFANDRCCCENQNGQQGDSDYIHGFASTRSERVTVARKSAVGTSYICAAGKMP